MYAHNINTLRFQDIDKPETFGFAPGQVTPFRIKKTDGDSLYAWHVMPLGAYSDHEEQAIEQMRARTLEQNFDLTELSKKLLKDQESRLVINCASSALSVPILAQLHTLIYCSPRSACACTYVAPTERRVDHSIERRSRSAGTTSAQLESDTNSRSHLSDSRCDVRLSRLWQI